MLALMVVWILLNITQYLLTSNELKEHANIDDKNKFGESALIWACKGGYVEVIKYLLTSDELKEHVNLYDEENTGANALIIYCQSKKWDITHYLIIEQNMKIDNDTMDWLINSEQEEVLNMIQSRDLYQKMNAHLSQSPHLFKMRKV